MILLLLLPQFFMNVSLLMKSFVVRLLLISSEILYDLVFCRAPSFRWGKSCVQALVGATHYWVSDQDSARVNGRRGNFCHGTRREDEIELVNQSPCIEGKIVRRKTP